MFHIKVKTRDAICDILVEYKKVGLNQIFNKIYEIYWCIEFLLKSERDKARELKIWLNSARTRDPLGGVRGWGEKEEREFSDRDDVASWG